MRSRSLTRWTSTGRWCSVTPGAATWRCSSPWPDPAAAPPLPPHIQTSQAAYAGTFASFAEQLAGGFSERLGEVRAPTVFVLGECSPLPVSQGGQTADLIGSAEVDLVPGAGHLPWYEQPGCVAAALARVRARATGLEAVT